MTLTDPTSDRTDHDHPFPTSIGGRTQIAAQRWRWYHLYFVLALFDVAVIVASIMVNRTTLNSFDGALADMDLVHQQQRWAAELGTALLDLNAPGNDIFESRDTEAETDVFAEAKARLRALMRDPPEAARVPPAFSENVEHMVRAEEKIFEHFRYVSDQQRDETQRRLLLAEATREMAVMDRAQAGAMAALTAMSLSLLGDQKLILDRHKAALDGRTRLEFLFVAVVALILAGVFWYGRKLQQTHEMLLQETERVETERRNRLASVGEVCFACAHGIRNPISTITSSAQLMLEYGGLDSNTKDRTRAIVETCSRLNERISRLLTFAHAHSTPMETLTPGEVLEDAAREIEDRLQARNIKLVRRYEAGNARFQGNSTWLVQAVGELLNNSLDHVPDDGTITLLSTAPPSQPEFVEFGVIDTGPGIPSDIRGRIFELFFTQREGGTGIGLASVQRAVDLHRGSVVVSDAEPTGADIRLRIPRVAF